MVIHIIAVHTMQGDKISLSKEAAEKLISARRRISVTAFDKASKISGMTVEFDGYFLNNEAVSVDIPKITLSKDASTLSTTFAGGTPEYVYKVGTIPSIKGVSFRSTFYNSGDGRFNVYAVDVEAVFQWYREHTDIIKELYRK